MSIGAASSRDRSASSSMAGLVGHRGRICPLRPKRNGGVEKAVENRLGLCGLGLGLAFERIEPSLQCIGFVTHRGGHRLDRFELLTANEIAPTDPFARALACRRRALTPPHAT